MFREASQVAARVLAKVAKHHCPVWWICAVKDGLALGHSRLNCQS